MTLCTEMVRGLALLAAVAPVAGRLCEAPAKPERDANSQRRRPRERNRQRGRIDAARGSAPPAATAPASKAAGGKVMLGSPELTAGIPGEGPLKMNEIETWLDDPKNHETLDFELPLGLAAGASQVQGRRQEPAHAGQDRAGPAALLRSAVVGRRDDQLRQLPQSRRRLRPAHAVRRRHPRPDGRPQFAGQLQPHSERPAVLGRPRRVARGSGHRPDRQSDRDGQHARGVRGVL